MVIFYNLTTNEILYTEQGVISPKLPVGDINEKIGILASENKGFISVPYEMNDEIFNYKVCFDKDNRFVGLMPYEKIKERVI